MSPRAIICSLLISIIFGQNIIDTQNDPNCKMDPRHYYEGSIITNICVDLIAEYGMSFLIDCDATSVTYKEYIDAECKVERIYNFTNATDLFRIDEGCDDPWDLNAFVNVSQCDDANYNGGGSGGKAASVNYTDCQWFGSNITNAPVVPVGVCTAHSHVDELDNLNLYSTKLECSPNGAIEQYEYDNTDCSGNPYNYITYHKEDGYFFNCGNYNNQLSSCPYAKIRFIQLLNDTSSGSTTTPAPTIPSLLTTAGPTFSPTISSIPIPPPTALPTVSESGDYANKDIGCNYVNLGGIAVPMDDCIALSINYNGVNLNVGAILVYNPEKDTVIGNVYFKQDCEGRRPVATQDLSDFMVGFYYDSAYEDSTCDQVSVSAYADSCEDESPLGELKLITDQCLYADTNTFMKLQCSSGSVNSATLNTYRTSNGDCSDENLINSTTFNGGKETTFSFKGNDIGCVAIEECTSGIIVTEMPTKSTGDPTPSPTKSPVVTPNPTPSPTKDYADQDIGCNYVDIGGGVAVPIDYCMDLMIDLSDLPVDTSELPSWLGGEHGMKMVCSDTWDSVSLEIYRSNECDGIIPLYTMPINSNMSEGFYCSPKYKSTSCDDEVSVNFYMDTGCDSGSYVELRVITGQCIYAAPGVFTKLECSENGATASAYRSLTGDCSPINLINSTLLRNGAQEEVDGEPIGCINVDGCSSAKTDDGAPSSVIIYIVITILVVIMIVVALLFAQRHYYKKKMQNVEVLNSNIGDATGIMAVPSTDMDDDKEPQVIFASDVVDELAIDPVANIEGEDKKDALLSGQMAGNE